jgi:hypothetical protein
MKRENYDSVLGLEFIKRELIKMVEGRRGLATIKYMHYILRGYTTSMH